VQKILVLLSGDVQVLHQTEQAGAVKITQLGFDVTPSGGGFVLVCHVEHCRVGAGAAVKTRTSAFVSSHDRRITKLPEVVLCAYLVSAPDDLNYWRWPVTARVGNVRNNDSSLIEPVAAA
jgi:hypothetical protein